MTTRRRKHVIGLTGNIACGKSTVVAQLVELGAEAIDGDRVAHANMGPNSPLAPALVAEFGPDVINPDGSVNRAALGAIVFSDPAKLARLEELAWPPVLATMRAAMERAEPEVLVLDAIKLIEAGIAAECDELWVVTCSREQQIARIMARNNVDRAEAERRIDAQPPQEEKIAQADVVFHNDGMLEELREQVLHQWRRLTGAS
ncbi:MAG: dephospho-CoA kinase [Chloroflexi bacterium]|nr:MAG: dephospho-CoA kinase [Chloroflexota bacterium]